ncbi:MAG TPA: hypothetical protein VIV60_00080 [Polyangiaceae bacterium]
MPAALLGLPQQELCILWTKHWAGQLGRTLLYQVKPLPDHRVAVGYFAYWSTERPWGDNDITRWVLPAVAIDAFYSHFFFVLPGVQRVLYGPGDIEGLRVTYAVDSVTHRLTPESVIADNATHREVRLKLEDAVDERGRILVYADTWSHQLGGAGALSVARAGANRQCYVGNTLQPITHEIAEAFHLGDSNAPRRAKPAWRLAANAAYR